MASGNFNVSSSNGYVTAICTWTSTPNTNGNYSDVYAELRASRTNSGYTTYGVGTTSITINGTQIDTSIGTGSKITQNSNTFLGSASVRVYHSSDGSCAIHIAAYMSISAPLTLGSTDSVVTLDTIPRASQPSLPNGNWKYMRDETFTINTNRLSTSFTNDIWYMFGNIGLTLIASGVTTSCTWTPPISLASQLPNATSGTGIIRCRTYNGSTFIGEKDIAFGLYVPVDIIPAVSATLTPLNQLLSTYIQNKSQIKVDSVFTGVYGSTCSAYTIKITQDTNISTGSGASVTMDMPWAGSCVVTVEVTDSRGRKTQITLATLTVQVYTNPYLTTFTAARYNSTTSQLSDDGDKIRWTLKGGVSSCDSKNSFACALEYKLTTDTNWSAITLPASGYSIDSAGVTTAVFSTDNSYDLRFKITDYYGNAISNITSVPTQFALFGFSPLGRGVSMGKIANLEDVFDCALPLKVQNRSLLDWVHPVGDIIFSSDATFNPTTYYGGTWLQISDKMIIGAGTTYANGATGGEATHVLTIAEMPNHNHNNYHWASTTTAGLYSGYLYYGQTGTSGGGLWTGYTGGGSAHNNMPPYVAKYIWQRTA